MNELQFENQLISYLSGGGIDPSLFPEITIEDKAFYSLADYVTKTQDWKYEPHIKTTEQLWDNFKANLERLNQGILDKPLSETEFNQAKNIISNLHTPYEAGQFLYGTNGVSQIEIDLDDGRHVYLTVFNQKQIGAGENIYQIVNQVRRPAKIAGRKDRIFDITLLINGLPIIQIEEKIYTRDVDEALNQMHQYITERQYSDIFSTVQILVAITQNNVKYMANTTANAFNKDFAFNWQTHDNQIVRKWNQFADMFLSIPMAHMMATNFMILDGTENKQSIKVMRPFQVYATRRVLEKLKKVDYTNKINKVGYIWHTTGSGKTITSFKTAWLASRLPNVDKVVFVVDRIQLTNQTTNEYRAFEPEVTSKNSQEYDGSILDTKNTNELYKKLKSKDNKIIVTSVQKLNRLVSQKNFKAPEKRFVFIVDEAHRSTGGDSFEAIQEAFKGAAWVGYTGTPMFDSTTAGSTTKDIFGDMIHAYTIREAIADKNVLGFKVDFQTTLSEEQIKKNYLPQFYEYRYPNWSQKEINEKIDNMTIEDIDDTVEPSIYDNNEEHIKLVVNDIYSNWKNRSVNGEYNALLTTHVGGNKPSIPMALKYFDEFQRVNSETATNGFDKLKVAITFSLNTTNNDSMVETNSNLLYAMDVYNKEFGTSFGLDDYAGYTEDVILRLQKRHTDGNYLDLVIVVDQLLTGFNAPKLNTLYVDRILKGHNLIQAYSRTNRIDNLLTKPFGRIINYRWPAINEKLMNDALTIYANRDSSEKSDEEKKKDNENDGLLAEDYIKLLTKTRELVEELRKYSNDFNQWTPSEEEKEQAFTILQQYNRNIVKLKQYTSEDNKISLKDKDGNTIDVVEGFDYKDPDALITSLGMTKSEENNLGTFLTNELKKFISRKREIPVYQLEFEITHIKDIRVNYDYLSKLLEDLMNHVHNNDMDKAKETKDAIIKFADGYPDLQTAEDIKNGAEMIFKGEYVADQYPVRNIEGMKVIQDVKDNISIKTIHEFMYKWGLIDIVKAQDFKEKFDVHTYGDYEHLDRKNELSNLLTAAQATYKELAHDEEIRKLSKINYRNRLRSAVKDLADHFAERA